MLTIEEVAERLRVSPAQVRAMIRRGELPAVKIGSRWRMTSAALEAHLEKNPPLPVRGARRSKAGTS